MGKRKAENDLPPAKRVKLSLDSMPAEILKMIADRVVSRLARKLKIKKFPKWPEWYPYLGRIVQHAPLIYTNIEVSLFGSRSTGYKISTAYHRQDIRNLNIKNNFLFLHPKSADILTVTNYHQYFKEIRGKKGRETSEQMLENIYKSEIWARKVNLHIDWTYRMSRTIDLISRLLATFQSRAHRLLSVKFFVDTWPGVINSKNRIDLVLIDFFKFCFLKNIKIHVEISSERGLHDSTRNWLLIFGQVESFTLRYLCPVLTERVKSDVNFIAQELTVSELILYKSETGVFSEDFCLNTKIRIISYSVSVT